MFFNLHYQQSPFSLLPYPVMDPRYFRNVNPKALLAYPNAIPVGPPTHPAVFCVFDGSGDEVDTRPWRPFEAPYPPSVRPLSYYQQMSNLMSNPSIPEWKKHYFETEGRIVNGRLAVSIPVMINNGWCMNVFADELDLPEWQKRVKGLRTIGLVECVRLYPYTYELTVSILHGKSITVSVVRELWESVWAKVVQIGEGLAFYGDLFVLPDTRIVVVPREDAPPTVVQGFVLGYP